jgi:uncharacterized membrane protein
MVALLGAFGLGFVAGLRAFTAPAALAFTRGPILTVLGLLAALFEYVMDLLPSTPSRTDPRGGLIPRIVSGGFCGWVVASAWGGSAVAGAVAGIAGALAGTYGGHAARLAAIARIGAVPAALVEDAVAIGLAAFIVTR